MLQLEVGAKSVVLPPGRYIIGDPCYHVPDEQWMQVLDHSDHFAMDGLGATGGQCWANFKTFDDRDGTVVAFATAQGDGLFKDFVGREFAVDSGLIGAIPFEDIDPRTLDLKYVHVMEFKAPFTCREDRGRIIIGFVEIDTSDEEPDEHGQEHFTYRDRDTGEFE